MKSLKYIFPKTSILLTEEEESIIEFLKDQGGYVKNEDSIPDDLLKGLVKAYKNNRICSYKHSKDIYYFLPDVIRMKTVMFRIPHVHHELDANGTVKIDDKIFDNQRKHLRRVLSQWILKKEETKTNKEFQHFLCLYTISIPCIMSFPVFLESVFNDDMEKVNIKYTELTPPITQIRCDFCGKISHIETEIKDDSSCPGCGRILTTEITL